MNRRLISLALFSVWLAFASLFLSIVLGISAEQATNLQKNMFFVYGTLFVVGIVYPLVYLINQVVGFKIRKAKDYIRLTRQAFLFASVISISAYLSSLNLFRLTDTITIALAAALLEFFFQANYSHVARRSTL